MLENATVTITLKELEELRHAQERFTDLKRQIAHCYNAKAEYCTADVCKKLGEGKTCCEQCKHYEKQVFEVDVERLIDWTKEYALFSKDFGDCFYFDAIPTRIN